MNQKPINITRRRTVLGFASVPFLTHCGGGSSPTPVSTAEVVSVAQPDANTTIFLSETRNESITATFVKKADGSVAPTTAYFTNDSVQVDLLFDDVGRPATLIDRKTSQMTQFVHLSNDASIAAQFDSTGSFISGMAFWKEGSQFYCGQVNRVDALIPQDVTEIKNITEAVGKKKNGLLAQSPKIVNATTRILQQIPLSVAKADDFDDLIRGIPLAYLGLVLSATWPALVVAVVGLGLGAPPLAIAALTLAAFVLLLPGIGRASIDRSRAQQLIAEYIARPFTGMAILNGSINIFADGIGPCTGSLQVMGPVTMTIGSGTTGRAVITGLEYIISPCFNQVFRKGNNIASLTRSGNILSGRSASLENPFIFNLTVDPSLSVVTGTIQYPYNFSSFASGFSSGIVSLRR